MNEELRDAIGRAFFDQIVAEAWEEQLDEMKELYMNMAEKVVRVHNDWLYRYHMRRLGAEEEDDRREE